MTAMARLCECGCGERTDSYQSGPHKGRPRRFVLGHWGNLQKGENHSCWKGGRRVNDAGYVLRHRPEHPRANGGCVREHILVVERVLGKHLPPGAEVHHVNGDRSDNRPRNLVVCQDHAYHMALHHRQRAMEQCGHAHWLACRYCKQWDAPVNLYITPSGKRQVYHRACYNERRKRWRHAQRTGR